GQVDGHQGRGAGAVHDEVRAAQIKVLADVRGDEVRVRLGDFGPYPAARRVVGAAGSGEHAHVPSGELGAFQAGVAQTVGGGLQEQPDGGVETAGLLVGEPEVARVELLDAVDESAPLADGATGLLGGPVEAGGVPALGRHLTDGEVARRQVAPERGHV